MHQVVSGAWNQDKEIKVGDPSIFAIKPRESVVSLCVIRMSVPCNGLNVKTANMLPLWDNSRDRLEKPLLPLLDCRDTVSPLPHILSPQP